MHRASNSTVFLSAALLLASCGGGNSSRPPGSCSTNADCASGLCVAGRCATPDAGPGSDAATVCIDNDGDGHGYGCPAGEDCDDENLRQTGVEVCDGTDNDCDGTADEGVLSECGTCDVTCRRHGAGEGTDTPFDLTRDRNEGVTIDPYGHIVLRRAMMAEHTLIWIANTGEGTVSKVDTRTFEELGRYSTGPLGAGNDPSRTSVDASGDVYVGNRAAGAVTKISALGAGCPDTNGDGVITTSTGPTDILAWGQDDCVLWTSTMTPEPGLLRAVAAQTSIGPDGELLSNVWVGGFGAQTIWKLDGATGAVLIRTPAPVTPYGFALDGSGNLWMASLDAVLGRIDTNRCISDATCIEPVCGDDGDACVKQRITVPTLTYGITVDSLQRVWLGGDGAKRYDPAAARGARWTMSSARMFIHGIAADGRGSVWGAGYEQGIIRIVGDDPGRYAAVPASVGQSIKGVAVDSDGKVWGINMSEQNATVVSPGPGLTEFTVWTEVAPGLVSPYTYSDMTGEQLRLAASLVGRYATVFEGCPESTPAPGTQWSALTFDADVPDSTHVMFQVRTADTRADLEAAAWANVIEVPPGASPGDIAAALTAAGLSHGRLLEVEVVLRAARTPRGVITSPSITSFSADYTCPDLPI